MTNPVPLSAAAHNVLKGGGVFVPSPLALDESLQPIESYQRLLTLYYIKSGAKAVIPGAHTGEFSLNNIEIFENWLVVVKEMTAAYGEDMILMAAIGGDKALQQAELAAKHGYDIVMVAPTAFRGLDHDGVVDLMHDLASIIPTFAFELQRAIPSSYAYSVELWERIFEITYGAKGASFDTYRSLQMLKAASQSNRMESLVMLTGNDDRIVADLLGLYHFEVAGEQKAIHYAGGLLGHFATDTHAAVDWVNAIQEYKSGGLWTFDMLTSELAHAVNCCNMELFDALGNFENSVWGVKYRLYSMGLLPGPYCAHEQGRDGQAEAIDKVYAQHPQLTDDQFVKENIEWMKEEVGLRS